MQRAARSRGTTLRRTRWIYRTEDNEWEWVGGQNGAGDEIRNESLIKINK